MPNTTDSNNTVTIKMNDHHSSRQHHKTISPSKKRKKVKVEDIVTKQRHEKNVGK
jgi:hypothetical protein